MASGLDTWENCTSQASCIAKNYQFVLRYYAPTVYPYADKVLGSQEAQALSSAGLNIGVVWETNPTSKSYFTYDQGKSDGTNAIKYAHNTINQPANSAIYFSVDYPANQQEAEGIITNYFQGISDAAVTLIEEGYPNYETGVYGDGVVCNYLKSNGIAVYSWLAGASSWPGSDTYSDWNLKQSASSITVCSSLTVDPDQSSGGFGGFKV